MRHFRSSRVADRDRAAADLLGADGGLEGTPISSTPDEEFSLRPLAASLPGDDVVVADPLREGTEIDHLLRRAREQVARGRGAEGTVTYREGIEDLEGATEQLTSALKAEPDAADLLIHRGALLGAQKLYAEAEVDLRRVLRRDGQHAG